MPQVKDTKIRIASFPKNYKFSEYLNSSLKSLNPKLDYFKFADQFNGTKRATNNHYLDLLGMLLKNQSNKLTKIASDAKNLFNSRDRGSEFEQTYSEYWDKREGSNLRRSTLRESRRTFIEVNQLANKSIRTLAVKAYNLNEEEGREEEKQEEEENEEEEIEEEERVEDNEQGDDEGMYNALQQLSDLASDEVGHLNIIDLSSPIAVEILKSEISAEEFDRLTDATNIEPIVLTNHAATLINALQSSTLSLSLIRESLHANSFKQNFDFILHSDASFVEVTARYFLDLQCSPKNPLNQKTLERTAATYFIIYIVNQLFLSDNDLVQLDWLEREFFATDKRKWDGVLIKVSNRSCSPGLIEFSGGCNDNTPSSKSKHDVTKLYSKLVKVLKKHPSNTTEQTFCLRYFNKCIYFEKLTCYKNSLFRTIHASIETPTSPRKLVEYVKEIPKILAWKRAVVDHTAQLR